MASANYDYDMEMADLVRRQRMADAMQGSSLQPLQMPQVGGIAGRTSPLEVLNKLLQSYVAMKGSQNVKEERGALSDRYKKDLMEGMEKYFQTSTGGQVPSMALAPNADGTPQMIQQPGDKRKAIYEALASNHPVLRELAMSQLKGSEGLTAKDLLPYATPDSIIASGGDMTKFKPKRDLKSLTPGEVLVDAGGNITQPGRAADGGQGWGTTTINGDLYQQSATGLKKLDNAPRISITNSPTILTKGQSELAIGRAKAANEDLATAEKIGAASYQALGTIAKMESVNKTFSGPLAPAAVWMGQVAKGAGLSVDEKKLANSETFESESAHMWINLMNQAGGARGLVKEESERIARAVPNLVHTPQGRQQLFDMVKARAQETQQLVKAKQAAMSKAAKADDANIYFEELGNLGNAGFIPVVPGAAANPNWLPPGFKILGVKE